MNIRVNDGRSAILWTHKRRKFFVKAGDLKELRAILQEKEGLKEWLGVCAIALNDRLIDNLNTPLKDGDVISLLPPVCGG